MIRSYCRFLAWLFLSIVAIMVAVLVCSARGNDLHTRLEIGELVQLDTRNHDDRMSLLLAVPAIAGPSALIIRLTDRP
jgi:hypothetical protein